MPRGWLITGAALFCVGVLTSFALIVVYPRVVSAALEDKLVDKVKRRLGREITIGEVDVSIGHATLRHVSIHGPADGDTPLVHVDRIELSFDGMASLVGTVRLGSMVAEGVTITLRRDASGRDNVSDVLERVRRRSEGGRGSGFSTVPTRLTARHIRLLADDEVTGATALVRDGTATWTRGELTVDLRTLSATTFGPRAGAERALITKRAGEAPSLTLEGGELAIWPKLALSGIAGTVSADPRQDGQFLVDLAGGYGGVDARLWTAKGGIDTRTRSASIDLIAAKFQLDRLAPLLERTPVVDYAGTSVDTKLHLDVDASSVRFEGALTLRGLNVGHPLIADKEVHDLDASAIVAGRFDRAARRLELVRGDFELRDLPLSITGTATQRVGPAMFDPATPEIRPRLGPGGLATLDLRLVIPPIECQRVHAAIPPEMAPYLVGYKLRGKFDADVRLRIDWAKLKETELGGHVGIRQCRVIDEPDDSPKRLEKEFEHYVEVDKDQWLSFVVGDSNEDFVPLAQISPHLINSIMSTEDSAFYKHRGFIVPEFRTALIKNLEAGRFRYGASSITMQFVKNVLLYREKTLARKLQELFLTWHVENTLSKDRILEIYFNVIEYGPGLYGIGPASWHYFSKPPKDLNPVEAAFFSSILPAPKERYKQYCAGTLSKWTTDKIQRILHIMHKRNRLTDDELRNALATPLLFAKDLSETEDQCLQRVRKAIKNARSTNPLKK